jgi:hypothetical protein
MSAVINDEHITQCQQGDIMKTLHVTALLVLTCLLGLGVGAHAQDVDGVVVTVPFDFVAGGATLPAGEYRIHRVDSGSNRELIIYSYRNGGAFVLPVAFDGVLSNQPTLGFEHVGGRYFLSRIRTAGGVYTMTTPPARIALAQAKSRNTSSPSGSN